MLKLYCKLNLFLYIRLSVEYVSRQVVKELKKSWTGMQKKISIAPDDFRQQMDKFMEVQ